MKKMLGIRQYIQKNKNLGLDNPWPYLKDTDKDRVPDQLDCAPRNPKKQGFISHSIGQALRKRKGVIGRAARAHAEYKKGAPEREKEKIAALERHRQLLEKRAAIAQQRAKLRKARIESRGTVVREAYAPWGGLFGAPPKPIAPVKRRRRRKTKKKRK